MTRKTICRCCAGFGVTVANALPSAAATTALTTSGACGDAVSELIDHALHGDLAAEEHAAFRQWVKLAEATDGSEIIFRPRRDARLLAGVSGGGKIRIATGMLERVDAAGFQYCVVDSECDYDAALPPVAQGGIGVAKRHDSDGSAQ